jgi:membrane protease YdiL (CAAX protease family)
MTIHLLIAELSCWYAVMHTVGWLRSDLLSFVMLGVVMYRRFGWAWLQDRLRGPRFSAPVTFLFVSIITKDSWSFTLDEVMHGAVVTPLPEELVYRLLIPLVVETHMRLAPEYSVLVLKIILSSFLFGFAHRHGHSGWDMSVVVLSGVALSVRAERTNDFFETVIIHALHNMHVLSGAKSVDNAASSGSGPLIFYSVIILSDGWRLIRGVRNR